MKKAMLPILIVLLMISNSCTTKSVKDNDNIEKEIQTGLKDLSKKLITIYQENNAKASKRKLAIITFVNENTDQSILGKYISNNMQTYMFNPKLFSLLERERIDSMLNEFEFNESGLINSLDSKKIGQMTGADLILVGTISIKETSKKIPYFVITCRLVELETGEILAIETKNIYATSKLIEDYGTPLPSSIKTIAGAYKLILKNIIIKKSKSNSQSWDADGSPCDIELRIKSNTSKAMSSNVYYDKSQVDGEVFSTNLILEKNDIINIAVWDRDALEDDVIGNTNITESQIIEILRAKKAIKVSFGQVEQLEIFLEKI